MRITTGLVVICCSLGFLQYMFLRTGRCEGTVGSGSALFKASIESRCLVPDGQMRDEVYNYGSFMQSKMFSKGVTCGDCHEPHQLKLRAPGNAVCAQCHQPAKYDSDKHSHHAAGTAGAQSTTGTTTQRPSRKSLWPRRR